MSERTLVLPKIVYLIMKKAKHQFKKGQVIEAVRSKGNRGGWVSRMDIRYISPGEAYEPDPTKQGRAFEKVEKYIAREYDLDAKETI